MTRVVFVDNFDSFTYNLVEYVSEHADTAVVRNTATLDEIRALDPDAVVVSPGPGRPDRERDVGVTLDVFRELAPEVPTFGVCMGLEAAVHAYGGEVGHAPEPVHGKSVAVDHDGAGVFRGLEQGLRGGRYHSLIATEVPESFAVTATATDVVASDASDGSSDSSESDGETELVMGVRHREHPIECVQFHPESVLTARGHDVVENFLAAYVRGDERPQARA